MSIIDSAAGLITDWDETPSEYTRALVELVSTYMGVQEEHRGDIELAIRDASQRIMEGSVYPGEKTLTVRELIRELQKFNPDQPIYVWSETDNIPITGVSLYETHAPEGKGNPLSIDMRED